LVNERLVEGIHDVSDGGLAVAVAEMAVKGGTGCRVSCVGRLVDLFGEGPSRVLLSVPVMVLDDVLRRAAAQAVPAREIGVGGGARLVFEGLMEISIAEAAAAWQGALPAALSGTEAAEPAGAAL
ncbi:MAG TPA: AIR synthase-related protein, partial [Acidimicrobiales bacterium]|nr:AIR synthase-related protein [Acidimicrobiales bacterium]